MRLVYTVRALRSLKEALELLSSQAGDEKHQKYESTCLIKLTGYWTIPKLAKKNHT